MTVSVQTPISSYTGNGVTTAFSFGYYVGASGDLVVMVDGVVQTLTTHYSLTGIGSGSGGTCTFVTAPASGASVVLYRDTDLLRDTDYQDNGDLLAAILDADFDRIWLALQESISGAKTSSRNVRSPIGETLNELPSATARAGKVLSFNASTGQPEVVAPTSGTATDLAIQLASTADGDGAELVGFNNSTAQTAGTVGAQLTKGVDPTAFPWLADATGATSAYSDIAAADIVAAAAGKPLVIPPGTFLIDTSYTFTAPVVMMPGAKLKTSGSGVALEFAAGFTAPRRYCIDTTGAVTMDRVDWVIPEWFGAVVGGTDCTAAMQRAHSTGRPVLYGRGSYWFTSITIANGGIYGMDRERTFLYCTDTGSANAITVTATLPSVFTNFQLGCDGAKTGGIGLLVDPGAALENNKLRISDVTLITFKHHVQLLRCVYFDVTRCSFSNHTTAAITMDNLTNPDGGDGNITECKFFAGTSGFSIIWRSGGGLRISRNKILDGANAIYINADLPSSTSDMFIENNSIENQAASGITIARNSGVGGITSTSICNNQFAGVLTPIQGGSIPASFINDLQIIGNQFQLIGGNGVSLANVTNPTIANNQFVAVAGSPTGINIISSTTGGLVGPNTFRGTFTNKVSMASSTVPTVGGTGVATVASAGTIALPLECDVFSISGTTGITTITALGWAGRTARLIFQGALTVTDGSNLRLAGNFVTTADDVLTLCCDGTNWFEVSRSAN